MLSEEDLQAITARLEAATPGPWTSMVEGRDHDSGSHFILTGHDDARGPDLELVGGTIEDQDFIAHARQDVALLLAAVRALLGQRTPAPSRPDADNSQRQTQQEPPEVQASRELASFLSNFSGSPQRGWGTASVEGGFTQITMRYPHPESGKLCTLRLTPELVNGEVVIALKRKDHDIGYEERGPSTEY